jgi:hypothetical protein
MTASAIVPDAVDPQWKGLYRVGGISAIVLALAYTLTTPLYAVAGAPPNGGEAWLQYVNGKETLWWGILGLSVLTDFLFVPVCFALYFALKGVNRNLALIGVAFVGLFAVLDLAVTWSNYAALITLGANYASAVNDAQRAALVAAATYADTVLRYSLAVYSIALISFGILVIGVAMLKGVFSRVTAYLGLATGILGIVSVLGPFVLSALGTLIILTSISTIIWLLFVGYRLFRLGQSRPEF